VEDALCPAVIAVGVQVEKELLVVRKDHVVVTVLVGVDEAQPAVAAILVDNASYARQSRRQATKAARLWRPNKSCVLRRVVDDKIGEAIAVDVAKPRALVTSCFRHIDRRSGDRQRS